MQIEKVHTIAIYVNGDLIDIDNQNQLNLRINNTVIDPTSLSTTQSEYSYEFDLPVTPNNNRIFDFANIPSKNAKFRKRFNCDVYSDGTLLFNGTLIIKSIKDNHYTCNLVQMKVYDLNDIFDDDDKLNKLTWEVPFDGFKTIEQVNKDSTTKYYFPFVSYGVFQKTCLHLMRLAQNTPLDGIWIITISGTTQHSNHRLICLRLSRNALNIKAIKYMVLPSMMMS